MYVPGLPRHTIFKLISETKRLSQTQLKGIFCTSPLLAKKQSMEGEKKTHYTLEYKSTFYDPLILVRLVCILPVDDEKRNRGLTKAPKRFYA